MIDHALRNEKIRADYLSGINSPALGLKYGISRERVRQVLEPFGVIAQRKLDRAAARKQASLHTAQQKIEFEAKKHKGVNLVRGGMSISKAAKIIGVAPATVSSAALAAGIVSQHGRWRDLVGAHNLAKMLVEQGLNGKQITTAMRHAGHLISGAWISRHYADAIRARKAANDNDLPMQAAA